MDRDEMRNGDGPPAVRVLPADGIHPVATRPSDPDQPPRRRWLLPVVMVGVALLAFVSATRPTQQPDTEAAPPTVPPGLSEVSTELIDLTNPAGAEAMTNGWEAVEFEWSGRINDVVPHNNSLFAFGADDEGAMAWLSSTGAGWRKAPRFERADNTKSSIDHAVVWDGDIVALGEVGDEVGLWTARTASHWIHHGTIPEMDGWQPLGLAATDRLLAIASREGRHRGWVSEDGLTWDPLDDVSALDEMVVFSLVGIGDWFYAAGQERNTDITRPAIYRSSDGVKWERATGLVAAGISEGWGQVHDLTTGPDGLLAVGAVGIANGELAVWESADGATWRKVASSDLALNGEGIVIELKNISTASEALLAIGDTEHRLVEGSEVLTDVGLMRVVGVGSQSTDIEWMDGSTDRLRIGAEPRAVSLRRTPQSIAVQGPRIVVAGWVGIHDPLTPAVWTSTDGGSTWSVEYPDVQVRGMASAAASVGPNITVVSLSQTEDAPRFWHSTWNTQRMEDDGVALVETFFGSIEQRDVEAILALLPAEQTQFQLPSLGGVDLPWWNVSTGAVDGGAVNDTIGYLEALDTATKLRECRSRVVLSDIDSVRISCGFDVNSALLRLYSNEDYSGTAEIIVENGAIQGLQLSAAPSATMWQMLAAGFAGQDPEIQKVLDNPTTRIVDPTFTAATAPVHLRVAEEFIAGLLRPGDTRIVETTLGTMEWTWLESLPLPVFHINWVMHHGDEFVAIGFGEPEGWTDQTTLWTSQDGLTWEPMDTPPGVTGMWNLQPFRNGLIAQAWQEQRSFLAFYDGSEWGEIELPDSESGQYFDVRYLVTSGDRTLVVTVKWSESYEAGPDAYQAWLIDPNNVPQPANLPAGFWEGGESIGLAGSDEGFLLATADYGSPRSLQIWFSQDGQEWDEIAATTSIDNAAYIWNMQRHRDTFFVVGEGAETTCQTDEEGSNFCQQLVGLWSSPDGADWERVFTTSGEPVGAYELGSGPLGLVAISAEFYGERPPPRPIYLSDGDSWERAGNLALLHPDAEWWWASRPAVGTDTIVIPGSAFDPRSSANDEQPFLIIGRLVDG